MHKKLHAKTKYQTMININGVNWLTSDGSVNLAFLPSFFDVVKPQILYQLYKGIMLYFSIVIIKI
jgi:hypothetical protein